jgi:hypothetical protein
VELVAREVYGEVAKISVGESCVPLKPGKIPKSFAPQPQTEPLLCVAKTWLETEVHVVAVPT